MILILFCGMCLTYDIDFFHWGVLLLSFDIDFSVGVCVSADVRVQVHVVPCARAYVGMCLCACVCARGHVCVCVSHWLIPYILHVYACVRLGRRDCGDLLVVLFQQQPFDSKYRVSCM